MNNEIELLNFLLDCLKNKKNKEGLQTINKYSDLIEKKYYDIIKLKLIFLINLAKYIDALVLIKEELSVPYIPRDFEQFLNEKSKEIDMCLQDNKKYNLSIEELENIDKLSDNELLKIIPHLKEYNLNLLTSKIQNIFINENVSNLLKSLLIASLSDCGLDYQFEIIKYGTTVKFNPKTVFDVRDGDNYKYISNELNNIGKIDVNAFDLLSRLIVIYLLDLYPLVISQDNCDEIVTAAIILVNNMLSIDIHNSKYDAIYQLNSNKISKICEKMNILLETI